MTPLEIQSLLSVYCQPDRTLRPLGVGHLLLEGLIECKTPGSRFNNRRYVRQTLCSEGVGGLRRFCSDEFRLTPKGQAMVSALLALPLPVELTTITWKMPPPVERTTTTWKVPGTDLEFTDEDLVK